MPRFLLSLLALPLLVATVTAQEWTTWRGPARDGLVPAANSPKVWPASWREGWRVEVGEGYSSPVVAAGRLFVHSRRDPQEIVTAIDLASGKQAWQQSYEARFTKNQYATKMAKGPNATPLLAAGRLFTIGATGIFTAWDAASGKQLWSKDFSPTVDTSKLFCGTSASPLLVNGLVVVQVGSDVAGGQIVAVEPATGAVKWTWKGAGPGYASPVVIDAAATKQIVTLTDRSVVGVEPSTGRELWTTPFPDDWNENIATPVWTGKFLVVSGPRQGTHAYTLAQAGTAWTATEVWKNPQVTMYMSSPVFADGLIYGHSIRNKGQFVALDPATGVAKWTTSGRTADHASLLLTPAHLVFLTSDGKMIVAKRNTGEFTVEKEYDVAAASTYASPVLLGADLIVRDASSVRKLSGQ